MLPSVVRCSAVIVSVKNTVKCPLRFRAYARHRCKSSEQVRHCDVASTSTTFNAVVSMSARTSGPAAARAESRCSASMFAERLHPAVPTNNRIAALSEQSNFNTGLSLSQISRLLPWPHWHARTGQGETAYPRQMSDDRSLLHRSSGEGRRHNAAPIFDPQL